MRSPVQIWVAAPKQKDILSDVLETVEKVAKPLFRMRLHEILTSISCEIVGRNFVRGVISEAHVLGNDGIEFYSAVCGRRDSLQEGFFDSLKDILSDVLLFWAPTAKGGLRPSGFQCSGSAKPPLRQGFHLR